MVAEGEKRSGEYGQVYAESARARDLLGWECSKTIAESIDSLKKWYKRRPDGYGR